MNLVHKVFFCGRMLCSNRHQLSEKNMIKPEKLDFWIAHGYNVLFEGRHGVGKTSIVQAAFEKAGLNWRYFSAATLDPWVDLVGVPKERIDENGVSYLDLVRPKEFAYDTIEAVFFDELNRSHKKVRNALMELLQFKSINGKKFKNLKIIWAAINPDEGDEYDVEKLDPAQADRFHVMVNIPYKVDEKYFASKYPKETAKAAIAWWNDLPDLQKSACSPRRLDYALDIFSKNGDMRDVIKESCNVGKLIANLKHGPISEAMERFMDELAACLDETSLVAKISEIQLFLANENNFSAAIDWICKKPERIDCFAPHFNKERLSEQVASNKKVYAQVIKNAVDTPIYQEVIQDFIKAAANAPIVKKLTDAIEKNKPLQKALRANIPSALVSGKFAPSLGTKPEDAWSIKRNFPTDFTGWIQKFRKEFDLVKNTNERQKKYMDLRNNMPPTLTVGDALQVLDVLNGLADSSHVTTLEKYDNFMGVVNHCIDQISKGSGKNWDQIEEAFFKQRLMKLGVKIGSSNKLASRLKKPETPSLDSQIESASATAKNAIASVKKKKAVKVKL